MEKNLVQERWFMTFLMVLGQSIIRVEAGNKEVDRLRSRKARRDKRREKRSGVDLKEYE